MRTTVTALLTTFGAFLAIWGVLAEDPRNVIDSSYVSSDGPGMITDIFFPATIVGYIRHRNKASVSVVLICAGFLLALPLFENLTVPHTFVLLVVVIFLLAAMLLAGYTRQHVIERWRSSDCQIRSFFDLMDDEYFRHEHSRWSENNQADDHIRYVLTDLNFMREALDIDVRPLPDKERLPSLDELDAYRKRVSQALGDTSIFYYVTRPRSLVRAYM